MNKVVLNLTFYETEFRIDFLLISSLIHYIYTRIIAIIDEILQQSIF